MQRREIAVVGGGLAGEAAALAFARSGFDTVLIAETPRSDGRSTALLGGSVAFLRELGVMEALAEKAQPLATMRLIDDTGRLLRAPTVAFRAAEVGLAAFGYNVLNADLDAALRSVGEETARLERRAGRVVGHRVEDDRAIVSLDDGEDYACDLVVAADGRRSVLRESAGITSRTWSYPQEALVLNFEHSLGHDDISNEFHTRSGPFTQVPLPGRRSSLVWVEDPKLAELYADLKRDRLARVIEDKLHSILGEIGPEEPIQRFPLSCTRVDRITDARLALVGEAAHAFPPIGAQGLNLGLRDCETLARLVSDSRDDPGRRSVLMRYEAVRAADVRSRTTGVDLLNRSLLAGFLPVQALRSTGLATLASVPALRQFAMREGLSPGAGLFGLPSALREGVER